ncbi:ORF_84 [Adoxophyes orana granulovirus]|uniref:ADOR84 n=1 Tax=Adoxophyes orana granulovirus TaxID=170617 RepID=Q7T9T1_GVAO|nr:ORF_84 [Adoxophyes orana granulovirus]AAP85721.1 ORF_84 [Adoxophyes orana granulovirus]AJA91724.1 ADOR84 [Adoxophyes orana granulovirus]
MNINTHTFPNNVSMDTNAHKHFEIIKNAQRDIMSQHHSIQAKLHELQNNINEICKTNGSRCTDIVHNIRRDSMNPMFLSDKEHHNNFVHYKF